MRVTCTHCKRERLLDRDRLIADLTSRGLSTSWDMLPTRLRCACGSKQVEILAMPFTSGEEDGEALFEDLIRAGDRRARALQVGTTGQAECKEMSDAAAVYFQAKVAMRAWIVARSAKR